MFKKLMICAAFVCAAASAVSQTPVACSNISVGTNGALNGFVPSPNDAWHQDITNAPLDPNSAKIITTSGDLAGASLHPDFSSIADGGYGIPYTVVDSTQTPSIALPIVLYPTESDITLVPIPATLPVEGSPAACPTDGNDRHALIIDRNKCVVYELYQAAQCNSAWSASDMALFDFTQTEQRPYGYTSADAAGLSIFEGLVRYDEIVAGSINHALRFTAQHTKNDANYGYFTAPATHAAGNLWGTDNIMGMRIRLKASFDISGFSSTNQIILKAMKQYGMILADNGSNLFFQGTPDARWNDSDLNALKAVPSSAFDVVQMAPVYDSATAPTGAAPVINSFTASATSVASGASVTLTPTVTGASYSYIDKAGFVRGPVVVNPMATTTYTLTSRNAYGTKSASVTVTVQSGTAPTLQFAAVSAQTYGAAPFTVSATSNSTGAITYSVVSGPATVSGSTVTLTGTGTVTLQTSQAAAGTYGPGTAQTSFAVSPATPTLAFVTIPTQTFGAAPFAVSTTTNSSGSIVYSVVSGPATISGNQVTLTGTGTVTLQANEAAAGNYTAGVAQTTFTVTSGSDYSLSATPAAVARGAAGTSIIAVTDLNTFTGALNLTVSGLPSGVTASFSPATTTTSSILTLTAASWAAVGSTTLTITGTSGSLIHTTTLALTVSPPADFSFALSPTSITVPQGSSQTGTLTITGTNGFNSAVTFTINGLRAGVTASFSPPSTTGTSVLTLTATSTASLGSGTMVITGTSGSLTHQIYVSGAVTATADYSLSASPSNVSVAQGASGTSAISISPIGGFSGAVALTASGLPSGVTASFSPASTSTASTLTFTASSTAAIGNATVTITGISGTLTHTTTVNLTIPPAGDYSLSASPASVVQGASGTSTIAVTDIGGFTGAVSLSASGLPAGVTASFSPASTTSTSVLTLTASNTATIGPATITVTGISGSLTHTTTFTLTVVTAPDYSLSASPNALSIARGTAGTSTIAVTGLNNFTGSVALSASGLPAGVTASFSPTSTTGTSILTLTASSTATAGAATVTIIGISGSLTHTTTVALTVLAPDYSLSATPASVTVARGAAGTSTIAVSDLNTFAGAVTLTVSGLPSGVSATFSPATTTTSSILTLTAASWATVGSTTLTITGTSGNLIHTTTVAFTVSPPADFSFALSPTSISVPQGSSGSGTLTITGANGFNSAVTFTISGLRAGVTASFSPPSTSGTSVLTLTAASTVSVGSGTMVITGTSGGVTHQIYVMGAVTAAP